ncbi:Imm1 family immunity protein, partial [Lentzea sp.]|uniref:Imm1 family immunity protein n=1 Tax=Lentzea sp. TaxID=56099 RepID=UPI002B675D44
MYATRGEQSAAKSPTLYIDTDTRTPFPANAAIPIDRIFAALEEFHQTGERPTCVDLAGIGR